jgi:GxxExxY protein
MDNTRKEVNALSFKVVGAAIEVHKHLGPGLLESIYQKCFAIELLERGINFQQEVEIPILYKGHWVQGHLKCDFFIEDFVSDKIIKDKIYNYFLTRPMPNGVWGVDYTQLNEFTVNATVWDVNSYYNKLESLNTNTKVTTCPTTAEVVNNLTFL